MLFPPHAPWWFNAVTLLELIGVAGLYIFFFIGASCEREDYKVAQLWKLYYRYTNNRSKYCYVSQPSSRKPAYWEEVDFPHDDVA